MLPAWARRGDGRRSVLDDSLGCVEGGAPRRVCVSRGFTWFLTRCVASRAAMASSACHSPPTDSDQASYSSPLATADGARSAMAAASAPALKRCSSRGQRAHDDAKRMSLLVVSSRKLPAHRSAPSERRPRPRTVRAPEHASARQKFPEHHAEYEDIRSLIIHVPLNCSGAA